MGLARPGGVFRNLHACRSAGRSHEQQQHLLLCPCHQSTFDVLRGAQPTSGPATERCRSSPSTMYTYRYLVLQRPLSDLGRSRLLEHVMLGRFAAWIDGQLGLARARPSGFLAEDLPRPLRSFMLGEVALYALAVLVGSGTYLVLFFHPGASTVQYAGGLRAHAGRQHVRCVRRRRCTLASTCRPGCSCARHTTGPRSSSCADHAAHASRVLHWRVPLASAR